MSKNSSMIAEVIALYVSSHINNTDTDWENMLKEIYLEDKYIYDQVFQMLGGITNKGERWLAEKKYYIASS